MNYYLERQQILESIQFIQTTWRRCRYESELWKMSASILPLIPAYPWLGPALLDVRPWVEQQLQRYA